MSRFFLFVLLSILSSHAFCKEYYKKNTIDKAHRSFSKKILSLSNNIDDLFSDTKHSELENKSQLTISFDTFFRESKGPFVIPNIDYRLMLPNTQKKLQLFVEDDERGQGDDAETEQAQRKLRSNQNQTQLNEVNAGLRYFIRKSGIDFTTDSGVVVNIPIVFFARFTAKKNIPIGSWLLKIREELKWVNTRGITSNLDIDFDKRLTRKLLYRWVNNTFWNDQDYSIRFENGPSLFYTIDQSSGISYHAHVVSTNKPGFEISNYILQTTYRKLLYDKWLFLEASPFLNFPRENNFHRTPGFVLGLEAVFGHI